MTDVPNIYVETYGHEEAVCKLYMYLYREIFEIDFEINKSILGRNVGNVSRLIRQDPSQEMEDKEMGSITVLNYYSGFLLLSFLCRQFLLG